MDKYTFATLKMNFHSGWLLIILMGILFQAIAGCKKNDAGPEFTADFSYTFKDNNHVRFLNESEGEYYSLTWDFGNGETANTTDKKKVYDIYYPQSGMYDVTLKVLNYVGKTGLVTKTVPIESSALVLSFTADIDAGDPNFVRLSNTSTGDFDAFKWIYRDRQVENEAMVSAYFPFSGKYEIELQVYKDDDTASLKKTVTITRDDPGYLDKLALVWSDEFDGPEIDPANWNLETGATGWGNNELQNYSAEGNAEIVDGKLVITARKIDDNKEVGSYTSARLNTRGLHEFTYGRIEIKAKLPSGTGVWPAIWMLGSSYSTVGWPACGETDIMEYVGYQPDRIYSTVHTAAGYGGNGDGGSITLTSCEEEFHIYGLIWNEKEMIFYADQPDHIIHTYSPAIKNPDNWPFDKPQFFILNLAVGGNWGGAQGIDNSIFPQSLEIEYVRVYQEAKENP